MQWLLQPQSLFHREWNLLILFIILYNTLLIPFQISFAGEYSHYLLYFNFITDFFLLLDIAINFFTGYYYEGLLVTNKKKVYIYYLKTWFILDIFASLPLDSFALLYGIESLGGMAIIPILRIPRIIRILRILKYFRHWEKNIQINPSLIRLLKLGLMVIIVAHYIACAWFNMGINGVATGDSWLIDHHIIKSSAFDQYIYSFYWTLTTMTTVGYGDITPSTTPEILFTMIAMCIGVSIYAYIVGNMASLVANLDSITQNYRKKMDSINEYLRFHRIPLELQERIKSYYDYLWSRNKGLNEIDLLSDLPKGLHTELKLYLHREILQKVPLFKDTNTIFLSALVKMLRSTISPPGDYIINEGEIGREMYFISRGSVEVVSADGQTIYATLSEGGFFGEIALLFSEKRTASIRTSSYCDFFRLSKEDFESVLKDYPEFATKILQIAKERYKAHD